MRKKKYAGILLVISGLMLSGCVGKQKENTEKSQIPVTISILAGQSTSDAGTEDMIEDAVAERFPQVELQWECVDWGEDFYDRMRARLSSGDVPDIIIGKAQDVEGYTNAGILSQIEIQDKDIFYDEAAQTVEVDGILYGIPYNAWYQGVIYNKDIFEKYHISVPETKEEMKQIVQILEQEGITPFAGHFLESWKTGNLFMQFMIENIFMQSPNWGEDFRKGRVNFSDSREIQTCFEDIAYIYHHSFSNALSLSQADSDRLFDEGMAAMYPGGCWSLQFANQSENHYNYGIFPYPNSDGDSRLIRETNMTFMKSAYTDHGELVDEIFQLLMDDKELLNEILEFTQTFSVRKDMQEVGYTCINDDVQKYVKSDEIIEAAVGNSQIVWNFQISLAEKCQEWLKGQLPEENVLEFADQNRMDSGDLE